VLLRLAATDDLDANGIYLQMAGNKDGSATNDYYFTQTGARFNKPITHGPSATLIMNGATSGSSTVTAPAVAGSATITLPNASSTLPIYPAQITYTGPTAARTITLADASQTLLNSTASGVQTALTTPSSANLRSMVTDETGTGNLMFTRSGIWRNISIPAQSWTPSITNPPTASTNDYAGADVHWRVPVLSFANAANDTNGCTIAFSAPDNWDAGTVKLKIKWSTAATANDVKWQARGRYVADGGDPVAAWGSKVSVVDTAAGTASRPSWTGATGAMTFSGTPAAGGMWVIQVFRDAADGSDTLASSAELWEVNVGYTESATEPTAW
jgi:hypothetical protein